MPRVSNDSLRNAKRDLYEATKNAQGTILYAGMRDDGTPNPLPISISRHSKVVGHIGSLYEDPDSPGVLMRMVSPGGVPEERPALALLDTSVGNLLLPTLTSLVSRETLFRYSDYLMSAAAHIRSIARSTTDLDTFERALAAYMYVAAVGVAGYRDLLPSLDELGLEPEYGKLGADKVAWEFTGGMGVSLASTHEAPAQPVLPPQ